MMNKKKKQKKEKEPKEEVIVPKMDLLQGPSGLLDEEIGNWADAEMRAFGTARVWSEESQIVVTEVAVCWLRSPRQ